MCAIAITQRVRIQAISLAIVLAIIGQTQCFTLRYEYVRPHDLTAEESRVTEVRRELKRDIDETDEFHVAPIAVALIMTTESTVKTTFDNAIETTSKKNESLSDFVETTVIPNDITRASEEDTTASSSTSEESQIFLVQELEGVDNTTKLRSQEEIPTFTTTYVATDNYVEASANEAINNTSIEINNMISTSFTDTEPTTTESFTVGGVSTEPQVTVDITTESTLNLRAETTLPWKKYTKIERKPFNISEEVLPLRTERVRDSLNAHTTESRVSLEKAFDLAPDILSLQELKGHLMETTNSIPTTDSQKSTDLAVDSLTKEEIKTVEINPTEMVSLRAGYLDHTKPLIDAVITTTVNVSEVSEAVNEIEMGGAAYEMDTHDESEDITNKTSHSQMVEDAMKEELLKEAHLGDSVLYSTYKNDNINAKLNEITPSPTPADQITNQQQPEDLTVRPINYDKKNTLYTVNPNYKPLKKIEVQPSKPFMRDPDDNSWRNESLSSLGIVFKGKNSSKAFTEVLKNKTEIVMSNLPEQEKVLEKVELRDRLEKIAEKRKRKKKIDKFGNTEYGDYEENSSGDMHSSKEKNSGASDIITTTPTPSVITKEGIIRGSVTKATPDTGSYKKSKNDKSKTHNDYYDGKDDDVDYATFPNFDILKSTPRPRVQWPVTQKILDNAQPIGPYLPDRQPTVQYFPPLPKALSDTSNNYLKNNFKHKFTVLGSAQPQSRPIETYQYTAQPEVVNPGTYRTEHFIPDGSDKQDDRTQGPIENKSPIQHIEYRPVGATDDGSFSIRHYKDLLESAIKDADYDRNGPYAPTPVTSDEGKVKSEEYDYGRKEGLNRFVDYFNQNHERFKADFPVLFNTSIVHGSESGKVLASSSAMFKRLYNGAQTSQREAFSFSDKPFDPNCQNITVELSPAYELHYYVPEQEETGDHTMPYGYRT